MNIAVSPWHPKVALRHRIRRALAPFALPVLTFLFLALAIAQLILPAIAQLAIGGAAPAGAVDLAPTLLIVIQGVAVLVMIVGAWFIYGHVKDQNARAALMGIFEKAVSFGMNVTNGALKDKTLNVGVGSSVVASAVRYAIGAAPDFLKQFGFDEKGLARVLWARLPSVDGTVTDDTFTQIVAASKGTMAAPTVAGVMNDVPSIVSALLDEINRRKAGAATDHAEEPKAAATAAPPVTSAAPPPAPIT